jgi:hypothetical protein
VLPAARWIAIYSPATNIIGLALVGYVLLLTPTGSLPSPRWRWWGRLAAAGPVAFVAALTVAPGLVIPPYDTVIDPVAIPALAGAVLVAIVAGFFLTVAGLVVGAGSLVARFRRARGVERQQLRWLALAAALTGAGAAVVGVGMAMGATAVPLFAAGVCLALLPLATGAAILRYRLYDLDRIVSRTVAYGLLTVLLGLGYAVVVLGLGGCYPRAPAWSWPRPPWPWRRCSSRCVAGSSRPWTGASTAAATTPGGSSRPSGPGCATRWTWTP